MAFDGLNLKPFSGVKSGSATLGMANLPAIENKAKARLLANEYKNQQAIEAAKLGYQTKLDAYTPKETSWGDVAMGVIGSAAKEGLFDGFGKGGTEFQDVGAYDYQGSNFSLKDLYSTDLDFGYTSPYSYTGSGTDFNFLDYANMDTGFKPTYPIGWK